MAVYRDTLGVIDKQEFENHLKAITRREGYIEILMYTPDSSVHPSNVTSNDVLSICDMSSILNLDKYTSTTIATLEENLWLLNGRFMTYQGGTVNGYISNSMSNENGVFTTKPTMTIQLAHPSNIEYFSIILNSAVPTGYPKSIKAYCYDNSDNLLGTITKEIEWQEPTRTNRRKRPTYLQNSITR